MPYSVVAVDDVGCASTLRTKWVHITLYCIAGWPAILSKASICRWCLMPSEKHQEHQEKPIHMSLRAGHPVPSPFPRGY